MEIIKFVGSCIAMLVLGGLLGKSLIWAWEAVYDRTPPDFQLFGAALGIVVTTLFVAYLFIKNMLE